MLSLSIFLSNEFKFTKMSFRSKLGGWYNIPTINIFLTVYILLVNFNRNTSNVFTEHMQVTSFLVGYITFNVKWELPPHQLYSLWIFLLGYTTSYYANCSLFHWSNFLRALLQKNSYSNYWDNCIDHLNVLVHCVYSCVMRKCVWGNTFILN